MSAGQVLISTDQQALFNVQTQFTLLIEQLERLERVAEHVNRENAVRRNPIGDFYHPTVRDNLAALTGKMMCLSSTMNHYRNQEFVNACVGQLMKWYILRRGNYSPVLLVAINESLSACMGQYTHIPEPVELVPEVLEEYAARLTQALSDFHRNEERFHRSPQEYLERHEQFSVTRQFPQRVDVEGFRGELQEDLRNAPPSNPPR